MAEPVRVFINYWREDSSEVAGRLAERLRDHFQVLGDSDTIEPGMQLAETIRRAVTEADVFVAVIGPQWIKLIDNSGQRRLDDPNDRVTTEIAAALQLGVPVIPVLVDGARMPTRAQLPEALAGLASRQAVTLRSESFTSDSSRLVTAIERRIPPRREPESTAAQLADLDAQADTAACGGQWAEAAELLERIKAADPSYGDVARKLAAAQRHRRIAELHEEIRVAAAAANWQIVLNLGSELGSLDPANDDPDGLVTRARHSLAEARRRHLASLYDHAVQAEAAGRLQEAADAYQEISTLDPRNVDITNRLQAVRLRIRNPTATAGTGASAAMFDAMQPGPSGTGGTDPTPPGHPPQGPEPIDGAPEPEENKRALLPLILVAAALVLVAIIVAAVLLINSGDEVATPNPGTTPSVSVETTRTPSPTATPESVELTELLSRIPADIRQTCVAYEVVDRVLRRGVVAAVNCSPAEGPRNAWYFLYDSEAATTRAFEDFVTGTYRSGDCTKKQQMMTTVTTEDGKKRPAGELKCYVGRETNDTTFAWTNEDLRVLAFADDPQMTFAQMKSWWKDAGPFRNP